MRVAVTGGAGFVGSAIVRSLLAAGHHVLVVDDLSTGKVGNIEGLACDFHHVDAGSALYSSCEAVVHAAAYPDVSQNWKHPRERARQWQSNAELTRRVLEREIPLGCRFVLLSTCSVYGGGRVDESAIPRATSPYAASKIAAEALVSAYTEAGRIDGVTLRLVNVVGPRYGHGHIADFVRMAREGHVHALDDGRKAKSFVHADDVAACVRDCIESPQCGPTGRIGNVSSAVCWSWRDTVGVMRSMRPDLAFELTHEQRRSGWIGDPDELVVSSHVFDEQSTSVAVGVGQALESLGWMK
jgi:UDP-glucose 4-epimerase